MRRLAQIRQYLLTKHVSDQSEPVIKFTYRILIFYTFGLVRFTRLLLRMKPPRKTMADDILIGRLQAAKHFPSSASTKFSILIEPTGGRLLRGDETLATFDLSGFEQGASMDQRAADLVRDWAQQVDATAELGSKPNKSVERRIGW